MAIQTEADKIELVEKYNAFTDAKNQLEGNFSLLIATIEQLESMYNYQDIASTDEIEYVNTIKSKINTWIKSSTDV